MYEAVKPRQRRRQTSKEPLTPLSPIAHPPPLDLSFQLYDESLCTWDDDLHANSGVVVARRTPSQALPVIEEHLLSPALTENIDPRLGAHPEPPKTDDDEEGSSKVMSLTHVTGTRDISLPSPGPADHPRIKFVTPLYAEFVDVRRRRTLVDHFCNVLSRLIVLNEDSGNPFQRLVLPMCQRSEAVRNAVYALASAHREYRGLESGDGENSAFFYNQAIQGITLLIEKGPKASRNELLAAIMLLVYYEVVSTPSWVWGG